MEQRKSAIFEYFELSQEKNVFKCQLMNANNPEKQCNSEISAGKGKGGYAPTRASNLKRHLEHFHPKEFKLMEEKESNKKSSFRPSTGSKVEGKNTLTKYFDTQRITIPMTASKFKGYIIELVVKNGLPLSVFSSSGFIGLIGEMAAKLGVSLERHNIRKIILEEANNQKKLLKEMLKEKYIHLKMDSCTRQRVNYFAINAQFVNEKKETIIRTLAVRDTEAQHTSDQVCKLIENVLKEFEIKKENILTIVTDNASNMIKTVEKLNEKKTDFESGESCVESLANEDSGSYLDEDEHLDNTLDVIGNNFTSCTSPNVNIQHMRCGVHTLQLAIRDGLKGAHAAKLISKLRQVATAARNPKVDAILKRRCGKGAVIDQATRWGSIYLMIKRLLELKPLFLDMPNPDITLAHQVWEEVEQLEILLRHPYIATLKFQESYLTPGPFFKEWRNLIFKLSKIGGLIADGIKESMERRETQLLDNDMLLAAIYVDPNYRIMLSEDQVTRGKAALLGLSEKMAGLKQADYMASPQLDSSPATSSSEFDDDFEKRLDHEEKIKKRRIEAQASNCTNKGEDAALATSSYYGKFHFDFYQALTLVEKLGRKSKLDVIDAIKTYPLIVQNAAFCATALPPTQVSVERLFSALKLIKSDLRASMKEDLIEGILFLRSNLI